MLESTFAGSAEEGHSLERYAKVADAIRAFISSNFYVGDAGALADEASLLDAGVVDSTGVLEVVAFIEESFAIVVDDTELLPQNLDSIGRIARYVMSKGGS